MFNWKSLLERLKKPSVLASIISEIGAILVILNIQVDVTAVEGFIAAVSAILITLGILSNPTTLTKGYKDDVRTCQNCGVKKRHVLVGNDLLCSDCGTKYIGIEDGKVAEVLEVVEVVQVAEVQQDIEIVQVAEVIKTTQD